MVRILLVTVTVFMFSYVSLAQETIKIGALLPLTGPEAAYGEIFQRAYTLAAQEINSRGGIQGRPIEVIVRDTQSKPREAVKAAEELLDSANVLALVGGWSSDVAEDVAKLAQETHVPYLLDHPSSDDLTRKGWEWVFRLEPTAGMYPFALETFLVNVVARTEGRRLRVAYLYMDNPYGRQVWEFGLKPFFNRCKDLFDLIMVAPYQGVAPDFRGLLLQVKERRPDLLLFTSYLSDAVILAREADEMGIEAKLLAGVDGGHSLKEFALQARESAEGYLVSMPWRGPISSSAFQAWREEWVKRFGYQPGSQEAEGYAAIQVLAQAARGVAQWGDIQEERTELRDSLSRVDMDTVFGHVHFEDFEGYTNQNRAYNLTALYQWQGGGLFQVWPLKEAERPYLYPRRLPVEKERGPEGDWGSTNNQG